MTKQATIVEDDKAKFESIVSNIRRKEIGVDDAIEALDKEEFFTAEFLGKAVKRQKQVYVRRMFRQVKGEDNFPKFYHLRKTDRKGHERNFYKQLEFFTKEDYEVVAKDFHDRGMQQLAVRDHVIASAQSRGVELDLPFMEA